MSTFPSFLETLSVVMPVYNERYTVGQALTQVLEAPLPEGLRLEVLLVDDGSTDGSVELIQELAETHEHVQGLFHETNQGKGAALATGFAASTGDIVLVQDADLEYSPQDFSRLLQPILDGHADAVFGSRFLPSDGRRVLYFWHSVGNELLTRLSNACTNLNLSDMETGYKVVRGDLLRSIPIRSRRFGVEPELTAKLAKRGARIYEVPVRYRGRTYLEGKKITWRDGFAAIFTILKFSVIDDVYNEKYGHDILYSLSRTHRFNRWMADEIKPFVGEAVMEIGSGMGNLMQQFLPRSRYTASDIDSLHLKFLANRYGDQDHIAIRNLDINTPGSCAEVASSFDTVIALNVIEHVENDRAAFSNIHDSLQPGGRACILVPRGPKLYGSLDEVLDHYRRYTRDELVEKMESAGFEIETLFTFNRISVPAWWWNACVKKSKSFNRFQLKVFDMSVWFWRRVDRFLPWQGISLIAIGRKPTDPTGARE